MEIASNLRCTPGTIKVTVQRGAASEPFQMVRQPLVWQRKRRRRLRAIWHDLQKGSASFQQIGERRVCWEARNSAVWV